jgi:hypothetical protein
MTCPHCRADARCKGFRRRTALTLLGAVGFRRHYYHCPTCGHGSSPLDEALGLSAVDGGHDLDSARHAAARWTRHWACRRRT